MGKRCQLRSGILSLISKSFSICDIICSVSPKFLCLQKVKCLMKTSMQLAMERETSANSTARYLKQILTSFGRSNCECQLQFETGRKYNAHNIPFYRLGLYGFWKVMEIKNALFQDLESLERRGFSKWLWKSFGFLLGKILKIFQNRSSSVPH